MLEDLKEDEEPESLKDEEEIKSTGKNIECSNGDLEVRVCELKEEEIKSTCVSKQEEIMPQQEIKPLNDEVTSDVYDEDLSKPEHKDKAFLNILELSDLSLEHLKIWKQYLQAQGKR